MAAGALDVSVPRVKADFIARRGPAFAPWFIAALGIAAVVGVCVERYSLAAEAEGLELQLAAISNTRNREGAAPRASLSKEAREITLRLATPWGAVLDELESASRDSGNSIAILSVQPDREARRVTLVAEARSLPAALGYVQRLQLTKTLRHPSLDSHEVRTDSPDRPVRVQITAEWKLPT